MISKKILLFFSFLLIAQFLFAQNINGFEIPVSKDKLSSITFHSEITNYYFQEKNHPYKVSTLGGNGIMIQTSEEVKEPYNLFVVEGGRKHKFVIVYKDDIDLSEQDPDYSDLKQLDKLVKDFNNKNKNNQSSQDVTAAVNQSSQNNTTSTNQNNTANSQPLNSNNTNSSSNNVYALIDAADKAKNNQQYQDAKTKYEQALQIQPNNAYAQTHLAEVKKAIENESGLKYSNIMTKANNAFSAERYEESLKFYNDALAVKPGDPFSTSQIKLIQKKQETAKIEEAALKTESAFNSYINAGDKNLSNKSYDAALIAYNEALKIKPDNAIARSKINTIKQKIATDSLETDRKTKEDLYTSFLNSGNKALQEKSYDAAKMAYAEALKVKPGDVLATTKLNSIDQQLMTDRLDAEHKKTQGLHDTYIQSADQAFKSNLFDVAKSDYNEALKINANDIYAKSQIKKIDDALEKIKEQSQKDLETQKNKAREQQYNDIIKASDNYYNSGMYAEAKDEYSQALTVNSKDLYSRNKISQIDNLLSKQREKTKQDSLNNIKYTTIILKADEYFNNKDYANAKISYANALKYKNDDEYVKDKLTQIQAAFQETDARNRALKDSMARENETAKQYNAVITKAKAAYSKNDFVMARGFYVTANNLKPNEAEPQSKIAEIDNKLNELALQEQQKALFDSLSTAADAALADLDFTAAIYNYNEALKLNQPDQAYYVHKQIAYAQKQIALKDSLNNQTKNAEEQEKKSDDVMKIYKLGKDALKYLNYDSALIYFKLFVSNAENLDFVSNKYDLASLTKFSKLKINDIQEYLARERLKKLNPDTSIRKLPDVKDLPSITMISYYNPKDPKLESIYKKYPNIDFNRSPDDQLFDSISDYSQENRLISKDIMSAKPTIIAENSNNGIKLTCQNIIFKGPKVYIKLMLQNSTADDFLTGSMLLTAKKENGSTLKVLPNYVSGYPIILANQQKVIVYVTHSKELTDNDSLEFQVSDRLNKTKVVVTIPGNVYNRERKGLH